MGEEKVGLLLEEAGAWDRIESFVIGRSRKRSAEIDHAVCGATKIVVVEVKNWAGTLIAAHDEAHWILIKSNGAKVSMRNPVWQAARQASILAEMAGRGVEVTSLVVMAGRTKASQGFFPSGVIRSGELPRVMRDLIREDPGFSLRDQVRLREGWTKIVEEAFAPDSERRRDRYTEWLESRFGERPWRMWLVTSLAFATLVCVMGACAHLAAQEASDFSFLGHAGPRPKSEHAALGPPLEKKRNPQSKATCLHSC